MRLSMLALIATCAFTGSVIAAEDDATGYVAVRQNAMDAQGSHAAAIQKILTQQPDLMAQVGVHAQAIAAVAKLTPSMFPDGSDQGKTAALPKVWSDKAGFAASADKTAELATKLADAAKGGDAKATLAAFGAMGKEGCGGCHQTYRKRDN